MIALMDETGGFDGGSVCGVVLSCRHTEDILSVWCRAGSEREAEPLKEAMLRALSLPRGTALEYKAHEVSLKRGAGTAIDKPPKYSSQRK